MLPDQEYLKVYRCTCGQSRWKSTLGKRFPVLVNIVDVGSSSCLAAYTVAKHGAVHKLIIQVNPCHRRLRPVFDSIAILYM
jgi:hypothetical protein